MKTWKLASATFQGGTQEIGALIGKKVRLRVNLFSVLIYDAIANTRETTDLQRGAIGFVTNPKGADLLIAYSTKPITNAPSLNALKNSGAFFVVLVNSATFKAQFEIET